MVDNAQPSRLAFLVDLVERVEDNMAKHRLLRRGARVLVAVSGGVDSVVLLHILNRLAPRHGWRLSVAHLNHGLRGAAAAGDLIFVRNLARRMGIECRTAKIDIKRNAQAMGISMEMAAREARHRFLAEGARQCRARSIALAHHADDQVELFFLRLLRGAGTEGLSGMRWRSVSPADGRLYLIRPLLDVSKQALISYAGEWRLKFREDDTNRSDAFLRNRVRAELLPFLERNYQPALRQVILRQMEVLRAESDFVIEQAARSQPAEDFAEWPVAVQRKHLQRVLQAMGLSPGFAALEELRLHPHRPVNMPQDHVLERDESGRVREVKKLKRGFVENEMRLRLSPAGGRSVFDGVRLAWRRQKHRGGRLPKAEPGGEWFDAFKVGTTIRLRHWRAGDRFQPIGMPNAVKLQDCFTNLKIPAAQRRGLLVAATEEGEIWWVEGLRIGEPFKVDSQTKQLLRWTWQRDGEDEKSK